MSLKIEQKDTLSCKFSTSMFVTEFGVDICYTECGLQSTVTSLTFTFVTTR